jgi:hypothetical protein
MTLDQAVLRIRSTVERMDEIYRQPVFDEWAVMSRSGEKTLLLHYAGPRKDQFQRHYFEDTKELRQQYRQGNYQVGDFEFARHGTGTKAEAFIRIGETTFLVVNHTTRTMADIAANPLWLGAQTSFAELCDQFRADPVVHP